ncbi:hypothetical protein GGX14DRAFT_468003 [Mycena pura]|uniref:DUF4189 domain-containing protein n=1 Tax=Mycena pura TaxID=153505 RepID=A0AAD6V0A7_9AGAR|nr:hypothetical protein GGX14DRAFT_468003 [Mycena pura]
MKFALSLLTLAASGIFGVLGSPALQTSDVTTHPVHGFTAFDIPESVDAAPAPTQKEAAAVLTASTHYWVCAAVSTSSGRYGWSRGSSESSALQNAKKECGKSDCKSYSCIEEGCVGIDFGSTYVALSYARGYGKNDGSKAASTALSTCRKKSKGCAKAGYFCAARIY